MSFFTIPFDVELNRAQKMIMNQPYRQGCLGRSISYIKEHPKEVLGVLVPTDAWEINIGLLTVAGTSSLFASMASAIAYGALQNDPAVCYPIFVGGTYLGLAVYEAVVIVTNINSIRASGAYQAWKMKHIELMESESIINFLKKDDILSYMFCPLSGKLPLIPAKSKEGEVTYDFHAAVEWLRGHPGRLLPGSEDIKNEKDLIFDYAHLNAVLERLYNLGDLLENEKNKRIYSLLCVKPDTDNADKAEKLLFVANICHHYGISNFIEIFCGKNESIKKSFSHIVRIQEAVGGILRGQRESKKKAFSEEYFEIHASRTGFISDLRMGELFIKALLIKKVKVKKCFGLEKFINFIFNFNTTIIVREMLDLDDEEKKAYFGSLILEKYTKTL